MVPRQTRGSSTTHLRSKRHIAWGITDPGVGCSLDQFIKTFFFNFKKKRGSFVLHVLLKYRSTVKFWEPHILQGRIHGVKLPLSGLGPDLIFVTNIRKYIRGEKIVLWRNFTFPCMTIVGKLKMSPHVEKFQYNWWGFIAIYAVLSLNLLFTLFCSKIYFATIRGGVMYYIWWKETT